MEEKIKQTNPTLHRYLFTVTTFSKLLALSLFIILPFLGFYLGMQYQQKLTVSTPVVSEVQKTTIPTPNPTSTSTFTPTPTTTLSSQTIITNSDDGKTFTFSSQNSNVRLRLSSGSKWTNPLTNNNILKLTPVSHSVNPGYKEWVLLFVGKGATKITSAGSANCPQTRGSACPMYLIGFSVTINVK